MVRPSSIYRYAFRLFSTAEHNTSSRSFHISKGRRLDESGAPTMTNFEEHAKRFFVFERVDDDAFRTSDLSTSRQGPSRTAYGGLIFAQALAAAENTVDDKLKPHAIHSFFVLSVDTSLPVQYNVRRIRDGRSFCLRSVEGVQDGKIVFTMQASFNVVEPDAAVHQDDMPDVPSWKELKSIPEHLPLVRRDIAEGRIEARAAAERMLKFYEDRERQSEGDLFEIRPVSIERHIGLGDLDNSRTFHSWFRAKGDLGDCEKLHRYLVAYNTDSTLAGAAYRPHYVNDFNPSLVFSLDHNVWMHQHEMRADRWMLFENTSSAAGRGRAFTSGKLWSEDGRLLLSCTQEIVLRSRGGVSRI